MTTASPKAFARRLETMARGGHRIFYVWQPGYGTFGTTCESILHELQDDPGLRSDALVGVTSERFFEPMWLVGFSPVAR